MQRTSSIPEGDGLFERIRVNRLLLQDGIDRLSARCFHAPIF